MRVFQAIATVLCLSAASLSAHGSGAEQGHTHYTLQPNETISAVARKFRTTVLAIKEANQLKNPDSVPDFTVLAIPMSTGHRQESDLPVLSGRRATTAGDGVNVRTSATTDSEAITGLDRGQEVSVIGVDGDWSHVTLAGGTSGWIRSDLLDFPGDAHNRRAHRQHSHEVKHEGVPAAEARPEAVAELPLAHVYPRAMPRPAPRSGFGEEIVRAAYGYRGTPYRYGGASQEGFDCSGFTSFLYGRNGVSLPHSARAQFATGRPVDKSNLKPGDLVFFHTVTPGISHVGVYIGAGKFVHASSRRQGEVRVDSLESGYYHEHFRGGRNFDR